MNIVFSKSMWEMGDSPLEVFLKRTRESGFDATEIYLFSLTETIDEIAGLHRKYGLDLIAQVLTDGTTPENHVNSFEQQFKLAVDAGAIAVNSHTGRDIFSFEENVRIIKRTIQLGKENGIPVTHETHRSRPTYSAVETKKYLEALPDMRLTADFSHWMVVHESDLSDQKETIELAIDRADLIHARVGYEEGPQVPDPRAPEWHEHTQNHLGLWQKITDVHNKRNSERLSITPEFGPPAYMHTLPYTKMPVADVWEINVYIMDFLREKLTT
jgi:sugar phosphate isomerase/epimerase